jgi:hypothetical protein
MRAKIRPWEASYLRQKKLEKDIRDAKRQIKQLLAERYPRIRIREFTPSSEPVVMADFPELEGVYNKNQRKERLSRIFSKETEVEDMLRSHRADLNAQVLTLEKEERDVDEIMADAEDEDEA